MMTPPVRRFTILDAMAVVAATAMGFAWLRMLGAAGFLFRCGILISRRAYIAQCANEVAFPFLTMWVLSFLILRLRRPRPSLRAWPVAGNGRLSRGRRW